MRGDRFLALALCAPVWLLLLGCSDGAETGLPPGTGAGAPGGAGGTGTAGGGTGGAMARLALPDVIDLPYVVAGAGGSTRTVEIPNQGTADAGPLSWTLTGSSLVTLTAAPPSIAAGASEPLTVSFAGAPSETIERATLELSSAEGTSSLPVYAVAGDPALGTGSWAPVLGGGGIECGQGITLSMPTAPFPHDGAAWTDDSVRLFLPEGYRDRGAQDLVVHFHGHSTTLAETLSAMHYECHVYASGADAVLVVPQGPVNAASSDFGKLMDAGGLAALEREVLVTLYREGRLSRPELGELVLTSHSGGYAAVALNLDPAIHAGSVGQVDLFDSLYGYVASYLGYAEGGGRLRSNYTASGGTLANNESAAATLAGDGVSVASTDSELALRDSPVLIYFADTTHSGSTRLRGAYGEQLRWGMRQHRHGPRIELRSAVSTAGTALVTWLAPPDVATTGFRVETSFDGSTWANAAEVAQGERSASFAWTGGARVRVVPVVSDLPEAEWLASDVYRMDDDPQVLVVDGFDRIIDGSYGGLAHDFAAIVGEAAGTVATVSNEAITEDGFDLSAWPSVVWLTGDESTADQALSADEQTALSAYVTAGGRLVLSGSEIGYDLSASPAGQSFLASVAGADFFADDSGSYQVSGSGPLGSLGSFGYDGPSAPYVEDFPDAYAPTGAGQVVLEYSTAEAAAVGIAGQAVVVGFPLELVDDPADRSALLQALLGFVNG